MHLAPGFCNISGCLSHLYQSLIGQILSTCLIRPSSYCLIYFSKRPSALRALGLYPGVGFFQFNPVKISVWNPAIINSNLSFIWTGSWKHRIGTSMHKNQVPDSWFLTVGTGRKIIIYMPGAPLMVPYQEFRTSSTGPAHRYQIHLLTSPYLLFRNQLMGNKGFLLGGTDFVV